MPSIRSRSVGLATILLLVGGLPLLWPSTASANPIIHPIAVIWPFAWLALVPVVLVEAAVARHVLGWNYGRSLRMAGAANLLSTLVGVPVGTCLNPFLLMTGFSARWLLLMLVLPLYGVSVACEAFVADKFLELDVSRCPIWRWALVANGISYLIIVALVILELGTHP